MALEALYRVSEALWTAERAVESCVALARDAGASWDSISFVAGVSRQRAIAQWSLLDT